MKQDHPTLQARIEQLYEQCSPTERRLAGVLIDRHKDLLGYSATELATEAGVSKASAARFFRRLGYADFNEFRQQLRGQTPKQSPLSRIGRGAQRQSARARLLAHVQADGARLDGLLDALDDGQLDAALALLGQARRVWIVGYRNSWMTAFYAHALFCQVRPEVQLLNEAAGREAEALAELSDRDMLLAIDFRRRTRRLPRVIAAAQEAGAPVLLISDSRLSALSARCALSLYCPTDNEGQSQQMFDSYVAAISLLNYLASTLAAQQHRTARARLARIERMHELLDDLESES